MTLPAGAEPPRREARPPTRSPGGAADRWTLSTGNEADPAPTAPRRGALGGMTEPTRRPAHGVRCRLGSANQLRSSGGTTRRLPRDQRWAARLARAANEVRVCCSAIPQVLTNLRFHSRGARRPGRGPAVRATGLQNDALVRLLQDARCAGAIQRRRPGRERAEWEPSVPLGYSLLAARTTTDDRRR